MRRTGVSSAAVAAILPILMSCGGAEPPPGEEKHGTIGFQRPPAIETAVDRTRACHLAVPREAPALVAEDAFVAGIGRCGELPFLSKEELHIAGPEGAGGTLQEGVTGLVLSPDGSRALAVSRGTETETLAIWDLLHRTRIGAATVPTGTFQVASDLTRGNGRFLPGDDAPFVVCVDDRLATLTKVGVEPWGPVDVDCGTLVFAEKRPVVAFAAGDGRLHVADFGDLSYREVEGIEYRYRADARSDSRVDRIAFSPDAKILLHQAVTQLAKDASIHPADMTSVVDVLTGAVAAALPFDATPRKLDDQTFDDTRPVFVDDGHLLVIPGETDCVALADDLTFVHFSRMKLLATLGDRLIALDTAWKGVVQIVPMQNQVFDNFAVLQGLVKSKTAWVSRSPSGDRLALEYDTGECGDWVEDPETQEGWCRKPVFALALLGGADRPQEIARALGRFPTTWLDDEWLLARGLLPDAEYGTYLVGTDSSLRSLGDPVEVAAAGKVMLETVWLDTRPSSAHVQLKVVDPFSGKESLVAEGASFEVFTNGSNAIAWMQRPLGGGPVSVWYGAMPMP